MKFFLIIKIIITKIVRLNISFLKREISGLQILLKNLKIILLLLLVKNMGFLFAMVPHQLKLQSFSLNFSKDDEILITSSNFHASIGPIKNLNCKPVFVDIDQNH